MPLTKDHLTDVIDTFMGRHFNAESDNRGKWKLKKHLIPAMEALVLETEQSVAKRVRVAAAKLQDPADRRMMLEFIDGEFAAEGGITPFEVTAMK